MRVLVDLDDVMWNLNEKWIMFLNEEYGTDVKYEDITDWNLKLAFPTLSERQLTLPLQDKLIWQMVEPKEGADEYIHKLMERKHEVVYVTSTYYKLVKKKIKYALRRLYPFISPSSVIITQNKYMIRGDVLVDDYPANLLGGTYDGILFDAPYNRNFMPRKFQKRITRAKDWKEVYQIILELEAENRGGSNDIL